MTKCFKKQWNMFKRHLLSKLDRWTYDRLVRRQYMAVYAVDDKHDDRTHYLISTSDAEALDTVMRAENVYIAECGDCWEAMTFKQCDSLAPESCPHCNGDDIQMTELFVDDEGIWIIHKEGAWS